MERMIEMKNILMSALATIVAANLAFAQEKRIVALVVQDHADKPCAAVPILQLTDALTAKLTGCGLQVINPYNSFGVNQNRDVRGERTPDVSAMGLAQKFKADGAITATVTEFLDNTNGDRHEFSIRIFLNLANAWSGAAVIPGAIVETKGKAYSSVQMSQYRQKYMNDLMYSAAYECAAMLKENPEFCQWMKEGNIPSSGLLAQMKSDPEIMKWIESLIDGKVTKVEAQIDMRLTEVERQVRKLLGEKDDPRTLEDLIDKMTKEMMLNSTFSENYRELEKVGGRRPIVVFGNLSNASNRAKYDAGLRVASMTFLKKLYDSKMFDIKDDSVLIDLAKRITRESIVEDGSLANEWKKHNSPDLFVEGEFIFRNELDDTEYYDLILRMHRLRHPGGVVWLGISTYPVKKEVSK